MSYILKLLKISDIGNITTRFDLRYPDLTGYPESVRSKKLWYTNFVYDRFRIETLLKCEQSPLRKVLFIKTSISYFSTLK